MSATVEGKTDDASTSQPAKPPMSQDWKHTMWYVGGAAAFLALTALAQFFNRTAPIEEFGAVGEEFYPDFVDPTLATSLEVFTFDTDTVQPIDFRVQREDNGRWVIPSHHDYPADAEERLGKTASSIIGITRGAMVTRWKADHGRYGVVNPKQDSLAVDEVEGVGQRITLSKDDDSALADYIIGKKVEGSDDQYYVRHPEEEEVYITKLDIDLSTKFTDWIETKLFEFSNGEVLRLTSNDYSFNEATAQITEASVTTLAREKTWSDDWTMESLDEATEELNKDSIRDTTNALADLEVVGVRPKQKGLTPELQLDRAQIRSQQGVDLLQQDLIARGFLLQPGEGDALSLISREGELYAGTEDGLRYRMYFGRVFTGSQEELEIGFNAASTDGEAESKGDDDGAKGESTEAEPDTNAKPGRYLFVRIDFDKTLLGDEPTEPVEPQKSQALIDAEKAAESEKEGAAEGDDEAKEEDGKEDEGAEEESELDKLKKEYADAQTKYRDDKRAYDDFQEKVKKGLEKAEELNRRFADWYYVIPGESFDKLKFGRTDLVKAKEQDAEGAPAEVGADANTNLVPEGNASPVDPPAGGDVPNFDEPATPAETAPTDQGAPQDDPGATPAQNDESTTTDDDAAEASPTTDDDGAVEEDGAVDAEDDDGTAEESDGDQTDGDESAPDSLN